VALGTRLGIQQTGFNWQQWGPPSGKGAVIQVDIDEAELTKGHPRVDSAHLADANSVLHGLASRNVDPASEHSLDDAGTTAVAQDLTAWWRHIGYVRNAVPLQDPENKTADGFLSPYALVDQLSDALVEDDILIPASSGSGQFVPMETFRLRRGQRVVTNKGLASMGYGLPAALGAAAAVKGRRVVLVEGDGSFSQSIQELGTLALHAWPVKVFLLDNDGYASIRTTQRNYFDGAYLGCDSSTGLGFPNWKLLADAFGIPSISVGPQGLHEAGVLDLLNAPGPAIFVIRVDPDQTYFPKVNSRIAPDGSMQSNPIHFMSPPLPETVADSVFTYLPEELK
jgi:acetolactate synthase-1/2/3 large subunit